jgi:hypothetical protein
MRSNRILTTSLFVLTGAATPAFAQTQGIETFRRETGRALTARPTADAPASGKSQSSATVYQFKNRADSLQWAKVKKLADKSSGFRIIVSLQDFRLWAIIDEDTLLSTNVAVATGNSLTYEGRNYKFETPRGMRTILSKDADPVWNPPDWLYVETAHGLGLKLAYVPAGGKTVTVADGSGRKLFVKDNKVMVLDPEEGLMDFETGLHLIFGETLYIPPIGTENRRVNGTLGKFKLALGDGYLLHGTPHKDSIGMAATHGCIRLRDVDIEWLYENIPVGTKVYIY